MSDPIDAALAARDYKQAADLYDRLELDAATADHAHPAPAEHLLCLLAADDLQSARFLWRRLPRPPPGAAAASAAASESEQAVVTAWSLARALLARDRPAFFAAAAAAHWPGDGRSQSLATVVAERVRRAAADAVERSYSVVATARVARLLGLDGPELERFCARRGWRIDGGGVDGFVELAVAADAREELRLKALQEDEGNMRGEAEDEGARLAQAAARSRAFDELRLLTKQLVRLQTTT